jgi:hypothetical protein
MPLGQTRPSRQRAHSAPGRFPGRPARHTPSLLVEVSREKPARFVWQQRIYADGLFTQQMLLDDGVGHREELPCLLGDLLPILQAAPLDRLPVLYMRRHISVLAAIIFPSPGVDILSPAKQASKQRDSLSGPLLFIHRQHRLSGGGRWILRCQSRNRKAGCVPRRPGFGCPPRPNLITGEASKLTCRTTQQASAAPRPRFSEFLHGPAPIRVFRTATSEFFHGVRLLRL